MISTAKVDKSLNMLNYICICVCAHRLYPDFVIPFIYVVLTNSRIVYACVLLNTIQLQLQLFNIYLIYLYVCLCRYRLYNVNSKR